MRVIAVTPGSATTQPFRPVVRWALTAAATVAATCALDIVATATGTLLVMSDVFDGAPSVAVHGFLAATYLLWFAGLRINLVANWHLLEQTGTSTNLASKLMF